MAIHSLRAFLLTLPQDSHTPRPASQHRPNSSTTPMNVPIRNSGPRSHSHSISLGTLNSHHRVTRRKSMTSNNLAAMAAAVQGLDQASWEALVSSDGSDLPGQATNAFRRAESNSTVRPTSSNKSSYQRPDQCRGHGINGPGFVPDSPDRKVGDGQQEHTQSEGAKPSTKTRNRRASDGAQLTKAEGKRVSGELRCEKCGKGYKHSSCLTKHRSVAPLSTRSYRLMAALPALRHPYIRPFITQWSRRC